MIHEHFYRVIYVLCLSFAGSSVMVSGFMRLYLRRPTHMLKPSQDRAAETTDRY